MITLVRDFVLPAAFRVLPPAMSSPDAARMLLAVAQKESEFRYRAQMARDGGRGPARGLWQFEQHGGVLGVLSHPQTGPIVRPALRALCYPHEPTVYSCYAAIEHNDVLAAVFARLLLWTLPAPLPTTEAEAWTQYREAWRPGIPRPEKWPAAWASATEALA